MAPASLPGQFFWDRKLKKKLQRRETENNKRIKKAGGDLAICYLCHDDETYYPHGTGAANGLGPNHPVEVFYEEASRRTMLNPSPIGPILFCDSSGGRCKVLCSTCHDPHSLKHMLLRVDNRGSALCLSCHRK